MSDLPEPHNHSKPGTGGDTLEPEKAVVEELRNGDWSHRTDLVERKAKLASEGQVDIHVSPSGDDSNPGTESEPVETIPEACSRIPKRLTHQARIYLDYGTSYGGGFLWDHKVTVASGEGFHVVGHASENPFYDSSKSRADIQTAGWNLRNCGGSDEVRFRSFNIDGVVQAFDSALQCRDILFTTGGAGSNQCIDAKQRTAVHAQGCDFENAGSAAFAWGGSTVSLRDCNAASLSGRPYEASNGSVIGLHNSDGIDAAASGAPNTDDSSHIRGGPNNGVTNNGYALSTPMKFEVTTDGDGYLLHSPDGTRYEITVDNSGNLQTSTW